MPGRGWFYPFALIVVITLEGLARALYAVRPYDICIPLVVVVNVVIPMQR